MGESEISTVPNDVLDTHLPHSCELRIGFDLMLFLLSLFIHFYNVYNSQER